MIKREELGIVINSHKDYDVPLWKLIWNINSYDDSIPIYVAIAGHDSYAKLISVDNIQRICVNHNSYDYTAMIEIVETKPKLPPYLLFLQDTMEIGPNTIELALDINPEHYATAAFGGQCNLVTYRYDYLLGMVDFILDRRNMTKRESIQLEGYLWKQLSEYTRGHYTNADCVIKGKGNPYSDVERIEEYYTALDITKWKANYGQNMNNLINKA